MPNITFMWVEATGPRADIELLAQLISRKDWNELLIPIPPLAGKVWYGDPKKQAENEEQERTASRLYTSDSEYAFVNEFWGSKWGICHVDPLNPEISQGLKVKDINDGTATLEVTECSLTFAAQGAWAPAVGLCYMLGRLLPKVRFEFDCEDECSLYPPHRIVIRNPQKFMLTYHWTEKTNTWPTDGNGESIVGVVEAVKKSDKTGKIYTDKQLEKMTEDKREALEIFDSYEGQVINASDEAGYIHHMRVSEYYVSGYLAAAVSADKPSPSQRIVLNLWFNGILPPPNLVEDVE